MAIDVSRGMVDTTKFTADVSVFIAKMKSKCDSEKYGIITNMLFDASKPMYNLTKGLVKSGEVKHQYTTKSGKVYKFAPGFLKRRLRMYKMANRNSYDPAVRITGFNKNPSLNAYYHGIVNVDHTIGKQRTFVKGQRFYETAMEQSANHLYLVLGNKMVNYLDK